MYDYCSLVQVPPETEGKSVENKMDEENASFHLLFPLLFTADEAEVTELGRAFPCGEKKGRTTGKRAASSESIPAAGRVFGGDLDTDEAQSTREKRFSRKASPIGMAAPCGRMRSYFSQRLHNEGKKYPQEFPSTREGKAVGKGTRNYEENYLGKEKKNKQRRLSVASKKSQPLRLFCCSACCSGSLDVPLRITVPACLHFNPYFGEFRVLRHAGGAGFLPGEKSSGVVFLRFWFVPFARCSLCRPGFHRLYRTNKRRTRVRIFSLSTFGAVIGSGCWFFNFELYSVLFFLLFAEGVFLTLPLLFVSPLHCSPLLQRLCGLKYRMVPRKNDETTLSLPLSLLQFTTKSDLAR